jgi:iron complex transport system ATP-binding protein
MASVYTVNRVGFHYGEQWVLRNIDLTIGRGEILGIIGPNGSGKTSLLKILGRLLQPQQGEVLLEREDLSTVRPGLLAQRVAMVPQEHPIVFPYTALEVVLMGRYPYLRMEVDGFVSRLFSELSGGEKQRVIIARALAQEPEVLLLDEPATFLDLHHQVGIYAILGELNRYEGMTLVLVSHDLNMASQFCHRLLLLDKGRVAQLGSPEEVLTVERIREIYRCEAIVDTHPVTGKPRVTPLEKVNHDR